MAHSRSAKKVNSYVPALSVYGVFAGAYIMHTPLGADTRQLVAVPSDTYPVGHDPSKIVRL